jgi:hypothetical protein
MSPTTNAAGAPRTNPPGLVDTVVAVANGVAIYSNTAPGFGKQYPRDPATGSYYIPNVVNNYYTGDKWECVEFAVRYYWVVYQKQIKEAPGDARNYWSSPNRGVFEPVPNDGKGTRRPQVGDLVVSTTGGGGHGHIGVVVTSTANFIQVANQNSATPIATVALTATPTSVFIPPSANTYRYKLGTFVGLMVDGWLSRK